MEEGHAQKLVLALLVVFASLFPVFCQFPRKCTDRRSVIARECCPTANDGSECGENSRRGFCTEIPQFLSNLTLEEVNVVLNL